MNRSERRRQKREEQKLNKKDKRKMKTQQLNQDVIDFNTARKDIKNQGSSDDELVFENIQELKNHMDENNVPFDALPPKDFSKVVAIELANYFQPEDPNDITGMMTMLTHDLLEVCNMEIDDSLKEWKKELDENAPYSFITTESEAVDSSYLNDLVTIERADDMDFFEEYKPENHHSLTDELIEKLIADGKIPQEEIDKMASGGFFDHFDLVWNSHTEKIHSRPKRVVDIDEEINDEPTK